MQHQADEQADGLRQPAGVQACVGEHQPGHRWSQEGAAGLTHAQAGHDAADTDNTRVTQRHDAHGQQGQRAIDGGADQRERRDEDDRRRAPDQRRRRYRAQHQR